MCYSGRVKQKNGKASIHAGLRRLALKSTRREDREKDIKRQIERHRFGRMQLTTVFSLFSSPVPKQIQFQKGSEFVNAQIIALSNQKGGTGKSTTCANLGVGLAMAGKKVLLIDEDAQASLTISLGHPQPDNLPVTLSDVMGKILTDQSIPPGEGILHHAEGVNLMPSSIQLSGMEFSLVNAMSRETILRQYLDTVRKQYTHILIDCQPSLGMLTINALAAADRVIVPVQAEYLPAKGMEQLLQTIARVRRQINPKLQIDGILLTMVDSRTNFAREISALLRETYGGKIKVFASEIPHSVRAKESSAEGKSIFAHDPGGKVAEAYRNLTREVIRLEKQRQKCKAGDSR